MKAPRLVIRDLRVSHGEVTAVEPVSLDVQPATLVGLVGPNGAGKTSLVEALAGLTPFRGSIAVDDRTLRSGHTRSALAAGVALCPADRGLFHRMAVMENLLVGGQSLVGRSELRGLVEQQLRRFTNLDARRNTPAGQLSGGEQQMLALARAMMARPRLLLLDEPTRGLSPGATGDLLRTLRGLADEDVTVLVVDQTADWLYDRVDRMLVMTDGRLVADSASQDCSIEDLVAAYFSLKGAEDDL